MHRGIITPPKLGEDYIRKDDAAEKPLQTTSGRGFTQMNADKSVVFNQRLSAFIGGHRLGGGRKL